MTVHSKHLSISVLLIAIIQVSGCATTVVSADEQSRSAADPWEPMNRKLYHTNTAVDTVMLRPLAKGYKNILPVPVRRGIANFFANLLTPRSAINNFLQGKFSRGFDDIARFFFNSSIGIGGIFDVASSGGLEVYGETFSQTAAVWGVPEGPYLMLPVLGPRTLLDTAMLPIDILADPLLHYDNSSVRDRLYALRIIDLRARLLTVDKFLEDSKDPYITLRESYLQNRQFDIYDGDPPDDDSFYGEFLDDVE